MGNYLRSELLFVAQVKPTSRPMDCTPEQLSALAQGALALARQSYATHGITNDLMLAQLLKDEGQTFQQYRHWVFGRDNQPCRVCGSPIAKETIGGRRLYYCPTCQG
jgi:endonuclease-8